MLVFISEKKMFNKVKNVGILLYCTIEDLHIYIRHTLSF
jgi:hypothetical protein